MVYGTVIKRPKTEQNLCLDNGYRGEKARRIIEDADYVPHNVGKKQEECREKPGFLSDKTQNVGKESDKCREKPEEMSGKISDAIRNTPSISISQLAAMFDVSTRTIERSMAGLRKAGLLRRIGGRKGGRWEVGE
jgi:ATP-dependent DNA helicase RecG